MWPGFGGDVCAPQVYCMWRFTCHFVCSQKASICWFIDRVLYSVTGGQHCHGRQDSSRVTGGQAFMEDGAGLRRMAGICPPAEDPSSSSVHGGQDFAGGCSELYIYLCKNDGVVRVCAV